MTNNPFFSFQGGVNGYVPALSGASPILIEDNSKDNRVSQNPALGMSKKKMTNFAGNEIPLERQWQTRRIFEFRRLEGPVSITMHMTTCASIKVPRFFLTWVGNPYTYSVAYL